MDPSVRSHLIVHTPLTAFVATCIKHRCSQPLQGSRTWHVASIWPSVMRLASDLGLLQGVKGSWSAQPPMHTSHCSQSCANLSCLDTWGFHKYTPTL
jgi:hypothetical protein